MVTKLDGVAAYQIYFISMDSCGSPEDIRYEQILNSEGYPLKSFYTEPPADLLPIASSYP